MTIFPGCKCCGPCWKCYGKELSCGTLLPYWQNVADIAGKHQEAFRLLDANIDSDARPPDIFQPGFGLLEWQNGSENRVRYTVLGDARNSIIEFQVVDDKENVFFLSAVSCLGDEPNRYYKLTMYALNEASPANSSFIKHVSISGVETVLYTGGSETQIDLLVDEDSQFFLGQYVADHFDGSQAIIELKSIYQLLNNLSQPVDYQCFENPPTEAGWQPIGDCHPDEAACEAECPPTTGGRTMTTTKTTGPGTELKNTLASWGIHPKKGGGCKCKDMEAKMNRGGPQWCRDHKEEILAHLEKEAKKRGLPFIKLAASKLIDLAIRRSERG